MQNEKLISRPELKSEYIIKGLKKYLLIGWIVSILLFVVFFNFFSINLAILFSVLIFLIFFKLTKVIPKIVAFKLNIKDFKRFDWPVNIEKLKEKDNSENSFDIAIAGGGIAGLSCGALLAKRGYKVLILEKNPVVGGLFSSFKRGEYTFNGGANDISELGEKGIITSFLREIGINGEDYFVKNKGTKYIINGKELDIPSDVEDFKNLLIKMFPEDKKGLINFFNLMRLTFNDIEESSKDYGILLPNFLFVKAYQKKDLFKMKKHLKYFHIWLDSKYIDMLNKYFKNEELKRILCGNAFYLGSKVEESAGMHALFACLSYYYYGGYNTIGGANRFIDRIKGFIEENNGTVLVNHPVDRIIVENGQAKGLESCGKIFNASVVVSNINAKTTVNQLIDESSLDSEYKSFINGIKIARGITVVYLGVNMDLTKYPPIIKDLDSEIEVVIASNTDIQSAPSGKSTILIIDRQKSIYEEFPERGTEAYNEKKKKEADILIWKVEKIIPDIRRNIEVMEVSTPKTIERLVGNPFGAMYVFERSVNVRKPYFKAPIEKLYFVGASVNPGGGIAPGVGNGMICANDICNWKIRYTSE